MTDQDGALPRASANLDAAAATVQDDAPTQPTAAIADEALPGEPAEVTSINSISASSLEPDVSTVVN